MSDDSVGKVRVGVIFKSYEPIRAMQEYAIQTEEAGLAGGFWVAEAYHWFRQYGLEARGCFATLAAVAAATRTVPIGLGITSPYMRHPTVLASEAAAIDEIAQGRFIAGLGVGKVGVEYLEVDLREQTPVQVHRESVEIMRNVFSGKKFHHRGRQYESQMPPFDRRAAGLRTDIPIFIGATGPYMTQLAGEVADGVILPGMTSPDFVRQGFGNLKKGFARASRAPGRDFPVGAVILAACSRDGQEALEAVRPYVGTYAVNKLRNIKNKEILSTSGLPDSAWDPFRKAIANGTDDNVTHLVDDEMIRAFKVVAGTPEQCRDALQSQVDAGLNMPLMEVVGPNKESHLRTIRLLGEEVVAGLAVPLSSAAA